MPEQVNYDGCAFCAHKTSHNFAGVLQKWDAPAAGQPVVLAVGIAEYVPSISHESLKGAILTATGRISAVCGVRFQWVDDANTANIKVVLMPPNESDGPGGVLADCQLAMPGFRTDRNQVILRLDPSEQLCVADNAPPNLLDITRIVEHEMIHGLGVSHIGNGNLMAPMYSLSIISPQAGDTVELQSRYGPALPPPPVTPAPVPTTTQGPAPTNDQGTELLSLWKMKDGKFSVHVLGINIPLPI